MTLYAMKENKNYVVKAFEVLNLSVNIIAMNAIVDMKGPATAHTIEVTLEHTEEPKSAFSSYSLEFLSFAR